MDLGKQVHNTIGNPLSVSVQWIVSNSVRDSVSVSVRVSVGESVSASVSVWGSIRDSHWHSLMTQIKNKLN